MARRLRTRGGIAVLATASALASSSVLAQSPSASDPADSIDTIELAAVASTKIVRSRGVAQAPVLDGDVLGDPAWADAEPVSGFLQTRPNDGQPATERTEVRVVFTRNTIYFGVVCYDRNPSAIIMTDSRRDSTLNDSDSFQMVLDTFSDQQNGFVFGTSPAGQEYDGQVSTRAAVASTSVAAAAGGSLAAGPVALT